MWRLALPWRVLYGNTKMMNNILGFTCPTRFLFRYMPMPCTEYCMHHITLWTSGSYVVLYLRMKKKSNAISILESQQFNLNDDVGFESKK